MQLAQLSAYQQALESRNGFLEKQLAAQPEARDIAPLEVDAVLAQVTLRRQSIAVFQSAPWAQEAHLFTIGASSQWQCQCVIGCWIFCAQQAYLHVRQY